MSAHIDGGVTATFDCTVTVDATYSGECSTYYFDYKTTTSTGTNCFAHSTKCNKWDDSPKTKWYSMDLPAPKKVERLPVVHYEVPPWEREWVERERVSEQCSVRDTRQSVWACRPRHGLSGK